MLTISAHQLGRRQPLFADYGVALPATAHAAGPLRLEQLLGHVVRAEVEAFNARQQQRRLLGVLGTVELAQALAAGRVSSGGTEPPPLAEVDAALAAVLQAFRDGLFLVVVDGLEVSSLQAELTVNDDSRVAFVRLTALAGG